MKKHFTLAIIAFYLFSLNLCQNIDVSSGGVTVSIMEQSGRLGITRDLKESMSIRFHSLVERDENGNEVGTNSDIKHNFYAFDKLVFRTANFTEEKYQNLTIYKGSIMANPTNPILFTGTYYVFTEEGFIETYYERFKVKPGTLLFSVEMDSWNFCKKYSSVEPNYCYKLETLEEGSFLDLTLEVLADKSPSKGGKYIFYSSVFQFVFPQYALNDETWNSYLPEKYISHIKKGESDYFVIRLYKFDRKIRYQFLITSQNPSNTWLILGIIFGIFALAVLIFFVVRYIKRGRRQEVLIP